MNTPPRAGTSTTNWLVRRVPRTDAPLRLYCFPHSGGSPGEYLRWSERLPQTEVWGVQAPGRGSRIAEQPLTAMADLVQTLLAEVRFQEPFVFFGHSLGALVAYETAHALRLRARAQPQSIVVSACTPPDRPRDRAAVSGLDDRALLAVIEQRYGGLPPEVTADRELWQLVLPYYRADFALFENYRYRSRPPLDVPLHVVGGDQDIPEPLLSQWARQTTGPFTLQTLSGGHFYFRNEPQGTQLLRHLDGILHPPALT
ncbi:alpha/beta fold hydrolase [Streptomyces sp. NPDC126514]|uniref:thioesterase II family protein n=1 Tax=Streptomyces sp. NPDC126514 TaxID=3155210 RepID=UPI00332A6D02